MASDRETTWALDDITSLVRELWQPSARAAAVRRVGWSLGKWFLGASAITLVVALAQIRRAGVVQAWSQFGAWWIALPVIGAAIPFAFVGTIALLEIAVAGATWLVLLVVALPGAFLDDARWEIFLQYAKKLPLVLSGILLVWCAWSIGGQTVAGPAVASARRSPGELVTTAYQFTASNPWVVALLTVVAFGIKEIAKVWLGHVAKDLAVSEPPKIVRIYGPDERVVREVIIDLNESSRR